MKSKLFLYAAVVGGALSIAGAPLAHAGTITETVWYPGTGSGTLGAPSGTPTNGMTTTPWGPPTNGVSIPKFDMAGETLDSITFSIYGQIDATVQAKNTATIGDSAATFGSALNGWSYDVTLSLLTPGGSSFGDAIVTASPAAVTLHGTTLTAAGAEATYHTLGSVTNSTASSGDNTINLSSLLSDFEGTGDVFLPLLSGSQQAGDCNDCDNVTYSLTTNAAAEVVVTYNYSATPMPEPTSLAAIGSALVMLGVARRRRKS